MKRYRITISIEDDAPEGTAMLYALTEAIKDVGGIVDIPIGGRLKIDADSDARLRPDGIYTSGAMLTVARLRDRIVERRPKIVERDDKNQ